ncbi:hypothetical protein CI109_107126 [Kwoniella shandongensis]|uniref:Uncharacterized protein n=1 Tax=Kwoniella shandongensis TaxID=1734106 RepID=A0A5M6C1R2_9TREE|nr:uncharacterized protein CI109_002409 [Kwoniella shandongensis]KAA5529068.1 hypothetical protein CI109_002409 [Kwoniella shandongensis]
MALGPIHCGSFLLLAATVLLLVSTISAPVIDNISFLNITQNRAKATLGVFGYCSNINSNNHGCTPSQLGYDIASVSTITGWDYQNGHLETLTKALILHPIATGLAFLSFLIALCSDRLGFLFASLIALLAFIVSLAALVIDFVLFGIIKHEINDNTSAQASFGTAIWLTLAATIVLFFSTFVVCFSCCTNRRRSRDRELGGGYASGGYVGNQGPVMGQTYPTTTTRKQHFWNRNKNVY